MKRAIKAKLTKLPASPGVYFFRNTKRQIIYVGKAANLKNRVRSYFQTGRNPGDYKTPLLIKEIAGVDWQTTDSEVDALFLESELIKRYKPKYNIELRDDKHYLYVKITTKDKYPTLSFVRRPLDDGASYFGPFVHGFALRKSMRYLRKIFPYNTHEHLPKRVCLQFHLGLCPGLEENRTSLKDYRASLRKLTMFLKGKRSLLINQLEKEMRQAAKAQDYERAAKLRNQALELRSLSKQIIFSDKERFDLSRDQALNGLREVLNLKSPPRRIEAYDISHLSGVDNVASMIVFLDGVPAKSHYRRFKMRLTGNDDTAHVREVVERRFSDQNLAKWPMPDLILIDGGKGQLAACMAVLSTRGIDITAIGLAKRLEEIVTARDDGFEVLKLEERSHVLQLLQRVRDEAHRFAISYQTLLRSKRHTSSVLEQVPGVGPATRKKLLRHFGSVKAIREASVDELAGVLGTKRAEALRQYL